MRERAAPLKLGQRVFYFLYSEIGLENPGVRPVSLGNALSVVAIDPSLPHLETYSKYDLALENANAIESGPQTSMTRST